MLFVVKFSSFVAENERDGLKDENRKLQAELEKLKASQ